MGGSMGGLKLAPAGGDTDRQRLRMREGVVDGLDGERGGLAPLAAAIEDAAADVRIEHLGLDGVRAEVEHGACEGDGIRFVYV